MKTNDLKKGMWVLLMNGWHGKLLDNKKGNTRIVDVYGDFHEAGSVYSHDIVAFATKPNVMGVVESSIDFKWTFDIQLTDSQKELMSTSYRNSK